MSEPPPAREPRRAGRWLAFLPAVGLLVASACSDDNSIDGNHLLFRNELSAFGFIALLIAILWVASERIPLPRRQQRGPSQTIAARGFQVIHTNGREENQIDL